MAVGCYDPQYIPASFKGVPFEALEVSSEHGRRGAEGEFPFGEQTAYADLGRRIRRYTLSARFVENNHIAASGALIAACETLGPGLLVHPTRGVVTAACTKILVKDNPLEAQGETTVEMEFVEANTLASGFSFGASLVGLVLTPLVDALRSTYVTRYRPAQVMYLDKPAVLATAADAMTQLRNEYAKAIATAPTTAKWTTLAALDDVVTDTKTLLDPGKTFDNFTKGTVLVASALTGQDKYDAFRRIANWAAKNSTLGGAAGESQDAVYAAIRSLAAGYMARTALEIQVYTLEASLTLYDQVSAVLNQELEAIKATCDGFLYSTMRDFVIKAEAALLQRAYTLPAIKAYDFGAAVPSLVAAYEIYNDAKRFRDIEASNPLQMPFRIGPVVYAVGAF